MISRNTRKLSRTDLLSMSSSDRATFLRRIRKQAKRRYYERKLVQSLLDLESLTINGVVVFGNKASFKRNSLSSTKSFDRTRLIHWR
jgi:hypothetical protein